MKMNVKNCFFIRITLLFACLCCAVSASAQHRHDMHIALLSGFSFSTISQSYYSENGVRQANSFGGVEFEYGVSRLLALSVGCVHSARGVDFAQVEDVSYRSWDLPVALTHYLPLKDNLSLSLRGGLTPIFIHDHPTGARARTFQLEGGVGAGIHYEFLFNWRISLRGGYAHSLQPMFGRANSYFKKGGRISEGYLQLVFSYNLNPDPLRKKQHKIPECLK